MDYFLSFIERPADIIGFVAAATFIFFSIIVLGIYETYF
jgi:hypothetical protein